MLESPGYRPCRSQPPATIASETLTPATRFTPRALPLRPRLGTLARLGKLTASQPLAAACWLAFLGGLAFILFSTLRFDFRQVPVAGDESSYLLQILSLADTGHNLNYDATDIRAWQDLDWATYPISLFFQEYDKGYAFAKPYGYSLVVAPFVSAAGAVRGIAVANSVIFVALIALSGAMLARRYRGLVIPLVLGAFYLAAVPYFYVYTIHTDLFWSAGVALYFLLAIRYYTSRRVTFLLLASATFGVLIAEKVAFFMLLAPVAALLLWLARRRRLLVLAALTATALTFGLAIYPYLHYSDFRTWSPYAGTRYTTPGPVPFSDPPATESAKRVGDPEEQVATGRAIADAFITGLPNKFQSLGYFLAGRHTGLLVFQPLALLAVIAAIITLRRRHDQLKLALLLGILLYVWFYLAFFPSNYWGGGNSLGNRYFLQASPAALALLAVSALSRRAVIALAVASAAVSLAFLWPHHDDPKWAFVRIDRTSWLQQRLPFEANQWTSTYLKCPFGGCG